MLWQGAYAELYFTRVMWPDFKLKLNTAIENYMKEKERWVNKWVLFLIKN